jgi:membrane-associated protease RseP (regulator of RpoE activity)
METAKIRQQSHWLKMKEVSTPDPIGKCAQLATIALVSALLAFVLNEHSFAADPAGKTPAAAGTCGWLGVAVSPMTASFAASLGMDVPYGGIFDRPAAGSPAAGVGIEAGDVLTTVNGNPLEKSTDFAGIIAAMAPGDTVNLGIRRNEQLLEVAPVLGPGKCP